jgi:flagellin
MAPGRPPVLVKSPQATLIRAENPTSPTTGERLTASTRLQRHSGPGSAPRHALLGERPPPTAPEILVALRIGTNIASMMAQRHLMMATGRQEAGFRRLASGQRIAVAADDASGLGISNRMRSEIRSWNAAIHNIDDGVSVAGVYDGALSEVSGLLLRMRELAVGAASQTYTPENVAVMDMEFQALEGELDRLAADTEFNGFPLLAGLISGFRIMATPYDDTIPFALTDVRSSTLGTDAITLGAPGPDPLAIMDGAIQDVARARARGGSDLGSLLSARAHAGSISENLATAESRIRDADIAEETALMARDQILSRSAAAVLAQANSQPALALRLLRP